MTAKNPTIIEPEIVSLKSGVELAIGPGGKWMIGTSTQNLHSITLDSVAQIDDDTFGFSAADVEVDESGGFILFAQSNSDENVIAQAHINSNGIVDPSSIKILSANEISVSELKYGVDLNNSGSFGSAPLAVRGDATSSLYKNELGQYQISSNGNQFNTIMVNGKPLNDSIIPAGWEISDFTTNSTKNGYVIYLSDSNSSIYSAELDSLGNLIGFGILEKSSVTSLSNVSGSDISGNRSIELTNGWTDTIQNSVIKNAIINSTSNGGKMDFTHLVEMMTILLQSHISAGNTPITSSELSDLQKISAHGKYVFGNAVADANTTDYLSYVFSKMVDGSVANDFYTGGAEKSSGLGSLVNGSSVFQMEKLINKWLLGKDLPSSMAGGDTATGKASTITGFYEHSGGSLFINGVAPTDIKQGKLGDCYFAASLVELASVSPNSITSMFVENFAVNGVKTWGVRFYDANGNPNWVTVDDELPVEGKGSTNLVFGGNPSNDLNGEIWFSLAEKAYVEANSLNILPRGENSGKNSYYAVEGGFGDPISEILGHKIDAYLPSSSNFNIGDNPYITQKILNTSDPAAVEEFQNILKQAINSNKPVWIGSFDSTKDAYGNILLTSGHAFVATSDPSKSSAQVWNPWGVNYLPNPPSYVNYLSPFNVEIIGLATDPNLIIMIG